VQFFIYIESQNSSYSSTIVVEANEVIDKDKYSFPKVGVEFAIITYSILLNVRQDYKFVSSHILRILRNTKSSNGSLESLQARNLKILKAPLLKKKPSI